MSLSLKTLVYRRNNGLFLGACLLCAVACGRQQEAESFASKKNEEKVSKTLKTIEVSQPLVRIRCSEVEKFIQEETYKLLFLSCYGAKDFSEAQMRRLSYLRINSSGLTEPCPMDACPTLVTYERSGRSYEIKLETGYQFGNVIYEKTHKDNLHAFYLKVSLQVGERTSYSSKIQCTSFASMPNYPLFYQDVRAAVTKFCTSYE